MSNPAPAPTVIDGETLAKLLVTMTRFTGYRDVARSAAAGR
jgi:hypothetical protein